MHICRHRLVLERSSCGSRTDVQLVSTGIQPTTSYSVNCGLLHNTTSYPQCCLSISSLASNDVCECHQYHKVIVTAEKMTTTTTYIQMFDAIVKAFPLAVLSNPKKLEPKNVCISSKGLQRGKKRLVNHNYLRLRMSLAEIWKIPMRPLS
jgi:hypothetical protein